MIAGGGGRAAAALLLQQGHAGTGGLAGGGRTGAHGRSGSGAGAGVGGRLQIADERRKEMNPAMSGWAASSERDTSSLMTLRTALKSPWTRPNTISIDESHRSTRARALRLSVVDTACVLTHSAARVSRTDSIVMLRLIQPLMQVSSACMQFMSFVSSSK